MKSHHDVLNSCVEIFQTVFSDPKLVVSEMTSASDIADWDSLAQIRLLMTMEQNFEIQFLYRFSPMLHFSCNLLSIYNN